jgi:NitT/TauT family transport system substrate-binding protein
MFTFAPSKLPSRGRPPRRALFWWLVLLDLILWTVAFVWRPEDLSQPPVVAVNVWPGSESFIAARESGDLSTQTINFVELTWATPAMRALGNRSVDAAILSLSEVALLSDLNAALRIMLVVDDSVGGDALVIKPGLEVEVPSIAHLKGRRIGVEIRSAGHYLLIRALTDAGLTLNDVEVVPINAPESGTAFIDFQVDVVATAEPWLTKLLGKGGRVLYDSTQAPGEFQRVLVVREEAAIELSKELREMARAHFGWIEKDWQDWAPTIRAGIGRREGLSESGWQEAKSRVRLYSRADQARLLEGASPELLPAFEKVAGTLWTAGMMQSVEIPSITLDGSLMPR